MNRDSGLNASCSATHNGDAWVGKSAYNAQPFFDGKEVLPGLERVDVFATFKRKEIRLRSLREHDGVVVHRLRAVRLNSDAAHSVVNSGHGSADKVVATALGKGCVWTADICFAAGSGERIDKSRGEERAFIRINKGNLRVFGKFLSDGEAGKATANNEDTKRGRHGTKYSGLSGGAHQGC